VLTLLPAEATRVARSVAPAAGTLRSPGWFDFDSSCQRHVGSWSPAVFLHMTVVIVASVAVLFLYQVYAAPDLANLHRYLPLGRLGGFVVGGAIFSVCNAILEEIVFRGVLFDAVRAARGLPMALIVTSVAFGIGHYGGYLPGVAGAVLAGIYAPALGILRVHSGGLGASIVAHVFADATIVTILARYG
jgi:membrane protease YdiL (CAAX protease family)